VFLSLLQRERLLVVPLILLALMIATGAVVSYQAPVPDFEKFSTVSAKKEAFFNYLRPFIDQNNERILKDRADLIAINARAGSGLFDRLTLARLRTVYANSGEAAIPMDRIDAIPTALALIQAAKESGWGTSRFARQGYNFFGQQCFSPGCGFTPKSREPGRVHSVQKFASPLQAVRSYMHNLNTHPRYQNFRNLRAELRAQGKPLQGASLVAGLESYSERGAAYVSEIKAMIEASGLE
jgi:Bax protein